MAATLHHTGLVVTDLDRAIEFYERFFGAEVELRSEAAGKEVAVLHGLEQTDFTIAILRIGDGRLELFEFRTPADGRTIEVRACDVASFHVAIQVDDARAKYQELVDQGVPFSRPPLQLGEGDLGEFVVAFCTDPDGNRVELLQLP